MCGCLCVCVRACVRVWTTTNATGISWRKWKLESEDKGDDRKRHTSIYQRYPDRECWKLHLPVTEIQTRDKNQDRKIQRRITTGRTTFAKHRDIFKGNIGTCMKRQVYNSCILPAMTYGAETWALTTQAKNKLAAAQTKMERSMLNITYRDRKNKHLGKRKDQGHRRDWTSQEPV